MTRDARTTCNKGMSHDTGMTQDVEMTHDTGMTHDAGGRCEERDQAGADR